MQITPLLPEHASDAARLHIAGQPGTFLTSLGLDVLTVFYRSLSRSPVGFGFVAGVQGEAPALAGFVSATTGVGRLFVEMGTRHLKHFLPPLLVRFARHPRLMVRSVQTVLYPFLVGEKNQHGGQPVAELLSIMVEPEVRGRGIGSELLGALVAECQRRQITRLAVTVDAQNVDARRFYERHGFGYVRTFVLYGRDMCSYQLAIKE